MERLLYRLSCSPHVGSLVLKGALLFRVWDVPDSRATRDIDFLAFLDNSPESIASIFREVCAMDDDDGLLFDPDSVAARKIKEDADYEGLRVRFRGLLGKARITMQIDIGFGDKVHPDVVQAKYPVILDLPAPSLPGLRLDFEFTLCQWPDTRSKHLNGKRLIRDSHGLQIFRTFLRGDTRATENQRGKDQYRARYVGPQSVHTGNLKGAFKQEGSGFREGSMPILHFDLNASCRCRCSRFRRDDRLHRRTGFRKRGECVNLLRFRSPTIDVSGRVSAVFSIRALPACAPTGKLSTG